MENIISGINSPDDIKNLGLIQLKQLAEEIREFLIKKVAITGGHLASNLGVVELTLALHKVFDTPEDKIIWDVGHQSYVHKIVTGRRDRFDTLRQTGGLSGFPKTSESVFDAFNTGHSSTSISAALGMAKGRDIMKQTYSVVAIIGDGALTGGMSFEALNDAGRSSNNLIVILNDNQMSISKNVGGLSSYLSRIRTEPLYYKVKEDIDIILNKIPAIGKGAARALDRAKGTIKYLLMAGVIFEELGFKYLGPIDGHDMKQMIDVLSRAKKLKGPILIHISTQKGKGYSHAEEKPHQFHGIAPFEIETGEVKGNNGPVFSDVFGKELLKLAEKDTKIAAVTASMTYGTGLFEFSRKYPSRFFDVGIAEQHAVTFAAGLAKCGLKPVVAVYSSFLQRAYDQILHDVACQKLHVVFAIDRAGLVGEDGETHQGLYDLSYLNSIPGMVIAAPCDYSELALMLEFALVKHDGPIAVRYPRGKGQGNLLYAGQAMNAAAMDDQAKKEPVRPGHSVLVREGTDITIVAVGNMLETALIVTNMLQEYGVSAEVIYPRFIKPIDSKLIINSATKTGRVAVIEDNTTVGGFGSSVLGILSQNGIKSGILSSTRIRLFGFPDKFIEHGSRKDLYEKYRLDSAGIFSEILKMFNQGSLKR